MEAYSSGHSSTSISIIGIVQDYPAAFIYYITDPPDVAQNKTINGKIILVTFDVSLFLTKL
jgi:hypothetical protein